MNTTRLKLKFALLFSFLVSSHVLAAEGQDVTKWSMKYMARASNALLVANDQALANEPILCHIRKNETQILSTNLKKLIDQKIKTLVPSQKKQIHADAENCDKDCTCDIYALALEPDSEKDEKVGKLLALVNVKGKKIESKERLACIQDFKNFCNGSLLKALR